MEAQNEEFKSEEYEESEQEENQFENPEYDNKLANNKSFLNLIPNRNNFFFINVNINNLNRHRSNSHDNIFNSVTSFDESKSILKNAAEKMLKPLRYNESIYLTEEYNDNDLNKRENNGLLENGETNDSKKVIQRNEAYQPGSEIYCLATLLKLVQTICKIETFESYASGFLIKFSTENKPFYCLMTNEHVITKVMIKNQSKIKFCYNNKKNPREIYLKNNRIIKEFTSEVEDKNIDATIIQILPEDNIDDEYFLTPNYNYMENFNSLIDKEIEIFQYPGYLDISYSDGKISDINNYKLSHRASTDHGSSGSPIFLKGTTEVIGIHAGNEVIETKTGPKTGPNYGFFIGPIYSYIKQMYLAKVKLNKGVYNNRYNKIYKKNKRKKININSRNKSNYPNKNIIHEKNCVITEKEGNEKLLNYSLIFQNEVLNEKNIIELYLDTITKSILG